MNANSERGVLDAVSPVAVVRAIMWACRAYWIAALALYAAKLAVPQLNALTEYGKLLAGRPRPAAWAVLTRGRLDAEVAWPLFYLTGVIATGLALAQALHDARVFVALRELIASSVGETDWLLFPSVQFGLLFAVHAWRRLYEALFVHRYSPRSLGFFQIAAGCSFYLVAPLTGAAENMPPGESALPRWLACVVWGWFAYFSWHQACVHRALAALRDGDQTGSRYAIPTGPLFARLSSPHYTDEIAIYLALATAAAWRPGAALLFAFVTVNLSDSALKAHAWYRATYGDVYPPARRALVPGVL